MPRLLDGDHPWGRYEATVSRYGVRRYSLTIYPPGASTTDRWLARLWRAWPITGAAFLLLGVMMSGSAVTSPGAVLTVVAAAYLGISMLLFFRTRPLHLRGRSLSIILMPDTADLEELRRYMEWRTLVDMLINADRMLATRAISPVEHEATWWHAYERLEAIQHA